MVGILEALYVLGEVDRAASFYPLVKGLAEDRPVVVGLDGRLLQARAGMAAAAGERWDAAEGHYLTALRQAEELPNPIEQAEVRRFHARMLLDRDGPGDRGRAQDLLKTAVESYRGIGMPKHAEMAESLLREAG